MWTHNQFNRNLLEHPEADGRQRVKQCQDVSCTHLYLLHGTQKQQHWFMAQLRRCGDFAISAVLNFICVLHLRELMPSREHKTEAKQTHNKIILLGWGQEPPDNLVYAYINPRAERSVRPQGELKVAGFTVADLLK